MMEPRPEPCDQLARRVAHVIALLREGKTAEARTTAAIALSTYCSERDLSVQDLLLDQRPAFKDDPVGAQDVFEVLHPAHRPAGGLVSTTRFLTRLS